MIQNVVEKLVPDPFLKNWNWADLWINSLKFYAVCFYFMPSEGYWNILKQSCIQLALSHIKLFYKIKRGLEPVSLQYFLRNFWRKIFLLIFLYWLTKFHCLVAFTSLGIVQYVYCNCLLTSLWRRNFWN